MPFCQTTLVTEKPRKSYPKVPSSIGEHIKKRWLDLRIDQKTNAHQIGVSTKTLHNWGAGMRSPHIVSIPYIIIFLGYYPFKPPQDLSERLLVARRHIGLSQRQMANVLSVDPGTYARWETGRRLPGRKYQERIQEVLRSLS